MPYLEKRPLHASHGIGVEKDISSIRCVIRVDNCLIQHAGAED